MISLTFQDLIAEDNLPLREIPLEEMRQKLGDAEVSSAPWREMHAAP
jgi:hypothetical protein